MRSWQQWLDRRDRLLLPGALRAQLDRVLEASVAALERRDRLALAELLGPREQWRLLLAEPAPRLVYLDVEATGLDADAELTVVSLWSSAGPEQFVAGRGMQRLPTQLAAWDAVVSFGGRRFDLPCIERCLGPLPPLLHYDLQPLARRAGLHGSLKHIERLLGIEREPELRQLDGRHAVGLWQRHRRGDPEALDLLLRYNLADARNLQPLLEQLLVRLADRERLRLSARSR